MVRRISFDIVLIKICLPLVCFTFNATVDFDVEKYLTDEHNETISYCGLNELTLEFVIHAIQLKNQKPFSLPDCYHFLIKVNTHRKHAAKFHLCL